MHPAEGFSDEHVFQASIGGELVAPGATCRTCNRECSVAFEAKFLNSVKVLTNVLGIANRNGNVPNINVTLRIDGRPFKGVLHADGELVIQNQFEQQQGDDGKLMSRWWLFTDGSFEQLQKAAAKRGQKLVTEEPAGRDIELEPEVIHAPGFHQFTGRKENCSQGSADVCCFQAGAKLGLLTRLRQRAKLHPEGRGEVLTFILQPGFCRADASRAFSTPGHPIVRCIKAHCLRDRDVLQHNDVPGTAVFKV
jgi:hypothetical protein